ncbi:MAG: 16S rRNA (adenine(1518)-N(6)/adenine(1519)-N(6))-dimethyltransferase RsmA [Methylacidiphilales bacterium]|nr:16S rRNA (adenine(1518)-N(6)/adenine(1519)-N(6))-dimethyltransferase RsmA [Candidatus Methylacidiphilales bacterium]
MYKNNSNKKLSQYFLVDQLKSILLAQLIYNSHPKSATVVEIGPGRGSLTKELLALGLTIHAVEIDPIMCTFLRNTYSNYIQANKLIIHQEDFLRFDIMEYSKNNYDLTVVGNIPYHISTDILSKLVDLNIHIENVFLLVQKEYADRLVASHSTKQYGRLTIFAQLIFSINILTEISRNSFKPIPKVDSCFIQLKNNRNTLSPEILLKLKYITSIFFRHRRKMLKHVLRQYNIKTTHVIENIRAEEISPKQFLDLCKTLDFNLPCTF